MRTLPALLLAAACGPLTEGGGVQINPGEPTTLDPLVAVITEQATARNDAEVDYDWRWERDGEALTGLDGPSVPAERTARGQTWTVTATPRVGARLGDPLSASVTILNAPPSLDLALTPEAPTTLDDLVASIEASDPDGDNVELTYAWSADGADRPSFTGSTISADSTRRDQSWTVTVTATDGAGSTATEQRSVTVRNSPPEVRDAALTPSEPFTNHTITLNFDTFDADGDTVAASISWTRNGDPISVSGSTIQPSATRRGDLFAATITPTDGTDPGTPVEVGPVEVQNSAPTRPEIALPVADPNLDMVCEITTPSIDLDADPITYLFAWELDGAAWTGATATTVHPGDTIAAEHIEIGQTWTCTVTATDGDATSEPSSVTAEAGYSNVTFRAGYYWVRALHAATSGEHAAVCAEHGLTATDRNVSLTWNEALLADLAEDFGYESVGRTSCCAPAMWCWDAGSSYGSGVRAGDCETHAFGSSYTNYGVWGGSSYSNQRPVFTCQ